VIPDLPCVRGAERVVFTAAAGVRDVLGEPGPLPPGWTAVAFTDGATHPAWRVLPLPTGDLGPKRATSAVKLLPHRVFPDARLSLWLDANFRVTCDVEAMVTDVLADADIALHAHPERDCIYDEALACIELGRDLPATICAQVVRYAQLGFPPRAGLVAGAVVLRRHTAAVAALNEDWWAEVAGGSCREQLSFDYVAWRRRIPVARFPSHLWHGPLFGWRPHAV
jgi:hypothetical protein